MGDGAIHTAETQLQRSGNCSSLIRGLLAVPGRGQILLRLRIPKGIFVLGSVNLTSKMTLHLLKGSKLLGVACLKRAQTAAHTAAAHGTFVVLSSQVSSPDSYPLLPALPSYGLNRDWSLDPSKRPFTKGERLHRPLLLLELRREACSSPVWLQPLRRDHRRAWPLN